LNCEDNESRYFFVVGLLLKNVKAGVNIEWIFLNINLNYFNIAF
jgi:hypothetical protein